MDAVIYARISADMQGLGRGVARQVEDCTAKATALGWNVVEVYEDNDVSASKAVLRPAYERLMADIESGKVRALVVYDLDRLTRKPAELETFIGLSDRTGVALANVSGDVDLSNANGRMIARIKGAVARQEAERIAERTARQKKQRVEQGKPLGQRFRTFGYTRDWQVVEEEAAVVREVFERAVKGESRNSISRDLLERGIETAAGGPWRPLNTTRLLKTPKYAGLQTYKGEVIGKSDVPALVDEATYYAAQSDHPTTKPGHNTRKNLLSGFLICDACKAPMAGYKGGRAERRYRCDARQGGCAGTSIKAEWLEDMVNAYMSHMVMFESFETQPVEDNRLEDLDAEIARIQGDADLDLEDKIALLKDRRTQRKALVAEQAAQVSAWQPIADYDTADMSVQRTAIARYIKRILVKPVGKGRQTQRMTAERIYVLMADGRVVPGAAIDTTDNRDMA